MSSYAEFPYPPSLETSKYTVSIAQSDLQDLKNLVRLSKLGRKTYENTDSGEKYGVTYEWMAKAKARWQDGFDWSKVENRINALPNFRAQVIDDDGSSHAIHYLGLFSQRKDAIPVICIHGWPGSFLEFLGFLEALKARYSAEELPYHIVVPSLPGFAFSQQPPIDRDWRLEDSARLLHKLMVGLGFGNAYAAQGGDIGSYAARIMACTYDSCKALHLNMCVMTRPDEEKHGVLPITAQEMKGLERGVEFGKFGTAYAIEQSTKPATIGFTLSSSPLALLAWIGEKFIHWTDETPDLDEILASVSLYWLTETYSTSIYSYRQEIDEEPDQPKTESQCRNVFNEGAKRFMFHPAPKYHCNKPMGFSWFPYELGPIPESWAATTGNLVWANHHDKGGHFAALEVPEALLSDVEAFLKQVWT